MKKIETIYINKTINMEFDVEKYQGIINFMLTYMPENIDEIKRLTRAAISIAKNSDELLGIYLTVIFPEDSKVYNDVIGEIYIKTAKMIRIELKEKMKELKNKIEKVREFPVARWAL